ncbi:hypothetical protein [Pararobbsia alpina]|uniref:Outer membrane protein beta-barrel domain-containing protein n=1 Tax=Pararobbsia alpina TaxID=621374 RepID=A0A6S7CYM3_9BURK|nr:hypothetical protein [Pararobbsia alpina]CAB3801277.1 hypothetical protein LMG28138_04986 [Pararobbsia alpina]
MCHRLLQGALVCAALVSSSSWADGLPQINTDTQWHFALTPYLWLPNVGGSLRFPLPGGGEADASTGPYNYLQNLRFAAMLQGEARQGDWSILADAIYLNFGSHSTAVSTKGSSVFQRELTSSGETSLKGGLIQLGGGHTIPQLPRASLDAIAGIRYLSVSSSLDASLQANFGGPGPGLNPQIHASQREEIFDGFVGVRGRASLTADGRWYLPFYLDVGTGTSDLTWQAMAGIGYAMKWGDITLSYRYLEFRGSGDQLVQTLRLNGPARSVTFRFSRAVGPA